MGGGLVVENDRRKVAAAAMRGTDTGRLVAGHGCCSRGGEPRSVSGWKPGAPDAATGRTALLSKLVSIVMGGFVRGVG